MLVCICGAPEKKEGGRNRIKQGPGASKMVSRYQKTRFIFRSPYVSRLFYFRGDLCRMGGFWFALLSAGVGIARS